MGSLLRTGRADAERNPLRPEVIGKALFRAIEACHDRQGDAQGARPRARPLDGRSRCAPATPRSSTTCRCAACSRSAWRCGPSKARATRWAATTPDTTRASRRRPGRGPRHGRSGIAVHVSAQTRRRSACRPRGAGSRPHPPRQDAPAGAAVAGTAVAGQTFGTIDPHLMELIRRLAFLGSQAARPRRGTVDRPAATAPTRGSGRGSGSGFDLPVDGAWPARA